VIARLFPPSVAVSIATPDFYDRFPYPAEAALVGAAIAARRAEFAAGRNAARAALAQLDVAACPIPRGAHGEPLWPDGFTGSITHCRGFCGAVAARRKQVSALGLDAELADPLDEKLARRLCRPEELAAFQTEGDRDPGAWAKLAFSAKEACFKALYALSGAMPAFPEISLRFAAARGGDAGSFTASLVQNGAETALRRLSGRWLAEDSFVFTGVAIMP
jgi:4'-phosphopantetheinyl transferase EntD